MCGIFGMCSEKGMNLIPHLHDGLFTLQHRGQQATGGAISNLSSLYHERRIVPDKSESSVRHFFSKCSLPQDPAYLVSGHNRYPTAGSA